MLIPRQAPSDIRGIFVTVISQFGAASVFRI